jgi:digeranylgeranylglycerophospholipid reductase
MIYDIAVVGAGPAGLQAAHIAARTGLKVILLERRKNISHITRACSMNLIMDENYLGETMKYEEGRLIFTRNKFEVPYSGPVYPMTDKYYVSPAGNKIRFSYKDHRPITLKFSKGTLLEDLLKECENSKVEFHNETSVCGARDAGELVELETICKGIKEKVKAKKAILADGVNSRTTQLLGLNEGRTYLGRARVTIRVMEGMEDYDPHTWNLYFGRVYCTNLPLFMGTGPVSQCETHGEFGNSVSREGRNCEEVFQDVVNKSPLAYRFKKAKIKEIQSCIVETYTPMKEPSKGNVLAIGDAAALVETQVQGALCCGFRAAHAIARELEGEKGFETYTKWWLDSFEFNSDGVLQVGQGYALVPTYTDEEIDYLFALLKNEVLEGTFSQYKTPKLMWNSILQNKDRIIKERPALHDKIRKVLKTASLADVAQA